MARECITASSAASFTSYFHPFPWSFLRIISEKPPQPCFESADLTLFLPASGLRMHSFSHMAFLPHCLPFCYCLAPSLGWLGMPLPRTLTWHPFPLPTPFPNSPSANSPPSLGLGLMGSSSGKLPSIPKTEWSRSLFHFSVMPALLKCCLPPFVAHRLLSRISKPRKLWKNHMFLITHLSAQSGLNGHRTIYSLSLFHLAWMFIISHLFC